MMDAGRHPNITLLTYSEVEQVSGYVGNFVVRVRKKARSIDENLCTGCGSCEEKCPRRIVDETGFNVGLGKRKAIYRPFAQAVPAIPVIDRENCTFFQKGKCKLCEKTCPTGAINYEQQDEILELEVGNIIVATGYDPFDAKRITAYGYGRYPNVFTSMEVERMLSGSGPTDGKIVLRDGETEPESIAIIHCVGSRDENYNAYCSKVCCMYSLKQAHLVRAKTNARMYQCFMDMRTGGKAYEEFYKRLQSEGVTFINGRPGVIQQVGDKLVVHVEDRALGRRMRVPVDMVILSVGLEARHDAKEVAKLFSINTDEDGWFKEKHPKLDPVATMTGGVFIAGCCQGPRDIPDSVAQGSAAAARVLTFIRREMIEGEAATAIVDEMMCVGCTQCVQTCPYSAIKMVEVRGGQVARVNEALCQGCGTCAGTCPSKAITLRHFTDRQLVSEMIGAMNVMRELELEEAEVAE
jgi:heterodisulfide reductase subunit A